MGTLRSKRKLYYLFVNNKKAGPYTLDVLKDFKILPTTLVNTDGSKHWVRARSIQELKPYLQRAKKGIRSAGQVKGVAKYVISRKKNPRTSGEITPTKEPLYYIMLNSIKTGPFPINELGEENLILRDTLIMYQGQRTWIKANDIPEIKPFIQQPIQNPDQKKPPPGPKTRIVKGFNDES